LGRRRRGEGSQNADAPAWAEKILGWNGGGEAPAHTVAVTRWRGTPLSKAEHPRTARRNLLKVASETSMPPSTEIGSSWGSSSFRNIYAEVSKKLTSMVFSSGSLGQQGRQRSGSGGLQGLQFVRNISSSPQSTPSRTRAAAVRRTTPAKG